MMINVPPEVRAWASQCLRTLARHFDPTFSSAQELQGAGVGEARIRALYPFNASIWTHGKLDLKLPARELLPPSSKRSVQQKIALRLMAEFATPREVFYSLNVQKEQLFAEMEEAALECMKEDDSRAAAGALHLAILLLHTLAEQEETYISKGFDHKAQGGLWGRHYPSYRLLVDDLVHLLPLAAK